MCPPCPARDFAIPTVQLMQHNVELRKYRNYEQGKDKTMRASRIHPEKSGGVPASCAGRLQGAGSRCHTCSSFLQIRSALIQPQHQFPTNCPSFARAHAHSTHVCTHAADEEILTPLSCLEMGKFAISKQDPPSTKQTVHEPSWY